MVDGRPRYLPHYSRRDHADAAEKQADALLTVYETLPDTCSDTDRVQALEEAQTARADATEARERARLASEPALRRPAQTRVVGESSIRKFFDH